MVLEHVKWDICESDSYVILFDRGRNEEQVTNVICKRCGLVFVNPRKPIKLMQARYTGHEFSINARGSAWPSKEKFHQSEEMAMRRFNILENRVRLASLGEGKVLEVGCGVGSFLRLMRGFGWDVLGVEPDPNYAEAGERVYGIPIKAKLFEEIDLGTSEFDIICAFFLIEHLASPSQFLRRAQNLLKVNGILYLDTQCIEKPYGGDLEFFFWSDHLYTFSGNTMRGLLAIVGFNIIATGYTGPFLWVIAQKTTDKSVEGTSYPFDDPDLILRRTLRQYRIFKRLAPLRRSPVWPVLRLARSASAKLLDRLREFTPWMGRGT